MNLFVYESGWEDSNFRPLRPERSTLPTAPHPALSSVALAKEDFYIKTKFNQLNNFRPLVPNPDKSGLPTAPHPALSSLVLAKD